MDQKKTTQKESEKNETDTKLVKKLMGEMPNLLAFGTKTSDGRLEKGMSTKRWTLKAEKEIGEMFEGNKGMSVSEYTTLILSHMCSNIGHHDMEGDLKPEAKSLLLNSMYMGDVYTAWIQLRIKALGPILDLNVTCPACDTENKIAADLKTIEVNTTDNAEDLLWDYELQEPIEIRGHVVTGFKFGPPRWNLMSQIKSQDNMGEAKGAVILSSIVSIHGIEEQIALAEQELDELEKIDVEMISARLNDDRLGPDMSVESKCSKCKRRLVQPIDWTYNNFFSISSP